MKTSLRALRCFVVVPIFYILIWTLHALFQKKHMNPIASRHLEKALKYEQNGRVADAIEHYEKAIKSAPRWSVPWYNLGLLQKYQCNWVESLRCNQKAALALFQSM